MDLQKSLFNYIKGQLPLQLSLVDEVAELLQISNDSAYRRIRGEKELTFSELNVLSKHFKFSLDTFLGLDQSAYIFRGSLMDGKNTGLKEYLMNMLQVVKYGQSQPGIRFYLEAKDILPLHHFIIPELAAFKLYFWSKTLLKEESSPKKFRPEDYDGELVNLAEEVSKSYIKIQATEIWSPETFHSSLRQVNYLWQSGFLTGKAQAQHLFEKLGDMINHLEEEVAVGEKFMPGSSPQGDKENFLLYYNDVLLGHNTILINYHENMQVLINHNVLNFMRCNDEDFCKYTFQTFQNIMKKSYCISVNNEKDRVRFFNGMRNQIKNELQKL